MKCYILGAGASYGFNERQLQFEKPPLTNQFFKKGYRLGIFSKEQFPDLYEGLIEYAVKLQKDPTDMLALDIDVEKFLLWLVEKFDEPIDNMDMRKHIERKLKYQGALGKVFYFIFLLLKHYSLLYIQNNNAYQRLALHHFEEKFNVISLNYDVLFEQAILKSNLNYRYGIGHFPFSIPIAKIHGSINLFNSMGRGIAYGGLKKDVFRTVVKSVYSNRINMQNNILIGNPDLLRRIDIEELTPSGTEYYEPVIIPPFANYKDYEKVTAYEKIWGLARTFLSEADEIVIIGCSIREEDQKFNELLSENIRDKTKIIIVSPSHEKTSKKIKKLKSDIILEKYFETFYKYSLTL